MGVFCILVWIGCLWSCLFNNNWAKLLFLPFTCLSLIVVLSVFMLKVPLHPRSNKSKNVHLSYGQINIVTLHWPCPSSYQRLSWHQRPSMQLVNMPLSPLVSFFFFWFFPLSFHSFCPLLLPGTGFSNPIQKCHYWRLLQCIINLRRAGGMHSQCKVAKRRGGGVITLAWVK